MTNLKLKNFIHLGSFRQFEFLIVLKNTRDCSKTCIYYLHLTFQMSFNNLTSALDKCVLTDTEFKSLSLALFQNFNFGVNNLRFLDKQF